ncbi:MAG TPA: DNA translocase FtsK 4TM domain-containing protein [Chloroflexia bacterium]|nr:DNA translocase FtsK 4TM domain-containing protein [Chloroflexia bacterium]
MPKNNASQKTAPGKTDNNAPKTRTAKAPALEPFKLETGSEPVINGRSGKKTTTTKMAAGRNNAADRLALTPPKEKGGSGEAEIIIKTANTSRRRSVTTSSAPKSAAPARRSSTGSGSSSGRRTSAPSSRNGSGRSASQGHFHETDRLPPINDALQHEITGIVLIVLGLILFFGLLADQGLVAGLGQWIKRLVGVGAFIIPPLIIIAGATFIWEGVTQRERFNQARITGLIFMVMAFVSMVHLISGNSKELAESGGGGGYFAYYINQFLGSLITGFGVLVLWLALFVIGLMLALSMSLKDMSMQVRNTYRWFRGEPILVAGEPVDMDGFDDDEFDDLADFSHKGRRAALPDDDYDDDDLLDELLLNGAPASGRSRKPGVPEPAVNEPHYTHTISLSDDDAPGPVKKEEALPPYLAAPKPAEAQANQRDKAMRPLQQNWKRDETNASPNDLPHREWLVPTINILANFSDVEVNPQELKKKARLIENTLSNFGVEAYVREVNTGPTVTQFALEPGIGVKVARITALANDLALALAAPTIRIEAPVPGQSRVGIEVPNTKIATVGLREIMEAEEYTRKSGRLKFALGRDVSGQPIITDLAKMPHLLIAGSTGSGKSVCLNSIVAAYLFQYRPNELQFIMIDPKMVELSTYNGIPHLRFPVVTQIESDPEKERNRNDRTPTVMSVLKWTIREMERRYKQLSLYGHRNIESFNKAAGVGNDLEKLPYLVLIVDELADLMMVAPEEAESAICRLAQKARAVGIHLILATQRPSVDVVTGLIKANFPSRITFAVTSQIDSRVILDMAGAEKLLGRGDMLFLASDAAKPIRVQGVYVGDEEIDTLVKHWRQQNDFLTSDKNGFVQTQIWPQELQEIEAESEADDGDELFEDALEIVRETRTASTSLLQRRLRIGYNRAARLIEDLEQAGVIGQAEGSRPRPVLLSDEDLNGPTSLTAAASAFEPMPAPLTPDSSIAPARPETSAPLRVPTPGARTTSAGDFDPDPPI